MSGLSKDDVWAQFHAAGFTDIRYAHPGPHSYAHYQHGSGPRERYGPRWHAGVLTGPEHDLMCVLQCSTNEAANRCLSPGGWSPEDVVRLALVRK